MSIVIAGVDGLEHVGTHLRNAASRIGLPHRFLDTRKAYAGPFFTRKIAWHLAGRRPAKLTQFSDHVETTFPGACCLITTGLAPIMGKTLLEARKAGVVTANFLTDDPWNPAHRAPWFLTALPHYDFVFTPRRANMNDLELAGCKKVEYLAFAYGEELHFPSDRPAADCDVFFAGGADADRLPWISTLIRAGINVGLYGGYWNTFEETRRHARGLIPPDQLNRFVSGARVCLCLVRKANRDGHCMRTFELAAMKACMLVERTQEHVDLFGPEAESVTYFENPSELVVKVRWLLANSKERTRLAESVYNRITTGAHTYTDRLNQMLAHLQIPVPLGTHSCSA